MSKSPSGKKSPKKNHKDKTMLYNDKCSKLEIALTLNGKTDTIFIDNKENISAIRDMVYNIYYPIQGKFQLIYKLKDISPFEDIPLYKYFKNLMKIAITVNPINTQNLLSRNELSTFNNSLPDVTEIDKNEASLAANQSQLSNGQNPLLEKDRLICNECHNKIISNFCRNCNLFLCKNCSEKYSSRHHDHLYVNVNIANIEKSAKNYKDIAGKTADYRPADHRPGSVKAAGKIEQRVRTDRSVTAAEHRSGSDRQKTSTGRFEGLKRRDWVPGRGDRLKNNKEKSNMGPAPSLRIIPLGGLEQIGMNITAFEYGDSIVVVDCGLAFPEDDMFGIDLVIPDTTYLEKASSSPTDMRTT